MFKPFVKDKLRKRMFFHGNNMSALHNYIAPSHLPKNYGGELPEIDYSGADWYPTMLTVENKVKGKIAMNKYFINIYLHY